MLSSLNHTPQKGRSNNHPDVSPTSDNEKKLGEGVPIMEVEFVEEKKILFSRISSDNCKHSEKFAYSSTSTVPHQYKIPFLLHATHATEKKSYMQVFLEMLGEGCITLKGNYNRHYMGKKMVWFAMGMGQENVTENRYGGLVLEIDPSFLLSLTPKYFQMGSRKFKEELSHTILAADQSRLTTLKIDYKQIAEDKITLTYDNNTLIWLAPQGLQFERPYQYDHLEIAILNDYVRIPLDKVKIRFVHHKEYDFCYHEKTKDSFVCEKISRFMNFVVFFQEMAKIISENQDTIDPKLGQCFQEECLLERLELALEKRDVQTLRNHFGW